MATVGAMPTARERGWARLLSPSLSDLYFLVITAWLFLSSPVGWQRVLLDSDTFLHARIGQMILADGAVPHQDSFSFSKAGQPWYAFEWLSQVALGSAYDLAGLKGLSLLAGVTISLFLTLLLKHMIWKGANGMVALLISLIATTATSIHYHARPHLFTLLFLTVALWILDYNRRVMEAEGGLKGRAGKYLVWSLIPLTAVWTNFHGGFFIFFALLGIRAAGCGLEAACYGELRPQRMREGMQLGLVGLACAAASLLNPYGYRLHEHILHFLKSHWVLANISEFQPPRFQTEEMYNALALLLAGLAIISSQLRKRDFVGPLTILFLAYSSFTSVRHITVFVLAVSPMIAMELTAWWNWVAGERKKTSVLRILHDVSVQLTLNLPGTGVFIPVCVLALAVMPGLHWPQEIPEGIVPVKLIEPHLELMAKSRLFASDQIAGYLIFRNYPRQRVFFDSRHNYYGAEIGDEYFAIEGGGPRWRELMERYRFDLVLIPNQRPLHALLEATGGWRVLASDQKYSLLQKQ